MYRNKRAGLFQHKTFVEHSGNSRGWDQTLDLGIGFPMNTLDNLDDSDEVKTFVCHIYFQIHGFFIGIKESLSLNACVLLLIWKKELFVYG